MNYTVLLPIRNDVKLPTPYLSLHVFELTMNSQQSLQALSMQLKKVFNAFITATLCTVHQVDHACSTARCIFGIKCLG